MSASDWLQMGNMVGLFLLRLGVPLLITVAVVYFLRRLDVKWQLEAAERTMQPAEGPRCWEVRNCPEETRVHCAAYLNPSVPCWAARRAVDGRLPQPCLVCALFGKKQPMAQTV